MTWTYSHKRRRELQRDRRALEAEMQPLLEIIGTRKYTMDTDAELAALMGEAEALDTQITDQIFALWRRQNRATN